MIELCEKIASFEDEKAALSREMINLRAENGHLATVRDWANILQEKLDALKTQSESMVSRDKYTKACSELDSALLREKQAEDLLKEQGDQLLSVGRQLESKHKEDSSREISLAESARELCEVKLDLSKKTHELRGLSRKLEELQLEKSRLQQSVTNADISARCAVRDGDMVACYVKAVNDAVEGFKHQLVYSPSTVNALMLPQLDEVVSGGSKCSNELKICHDLVINFSETLGHLTTNLHNQTNQIRTQKENIAALKQELLASTKPPMHASLSQGNKQFINEGRGHQVQSSASFSHPRQRRQTPDSDYGGSSFHSGLVSSTSTIDSPLFINQNVHLPPPPSSYQQGVTSTHSMLHQPTTATPYQSQVMSERGDFERMAGSPKEREGSSAAAAKKATGGRRKEDSGRRTAPSHDQGTMLRRSSSLRNTSGNQRSSPALKQSVSRR